VDGTDDHRRHAVDEPAAKVRYGTSPGKTQVVDIPSAGVTTVSIEGLTAGTWYFAMSSYSNTGVASGATALVSYTVRALHDRHLAGACRRVGPVVNPFHKISVYLLIICDCRPARPLRATELRETRWPTTSRSC
jgi:hypothetical protein